MGKAGMCFSGQKRSSSTMPSMSPSRMIAAAAIMPVAIGIRGCYTPFESFRPVPRRSDIFLPVAGPADNLPRIQAVALTCRKVRKQNNAHDQARPVHRVERDLAVSK